MILFWYAPVQYLTPPKVMASLRPLDLLQLCRVSRQLRTILLHPSSKGMWAASRKNIKGLPAPPEGLDEPLYATLVFEHHCLVRIWPTEVADDDKQRLTGHIELWPYTCKEEEL